MTDTLDYALHRPLLDKLLACISFIISFVLFVPYDHSPHHHSPCRKGLSTTSCRLLSSTKWKNHICHRMTSDAALVFSSCPDYTPTIGLRWFQGTKGLNLVGVFYVATPPRVVKSALAPYPYPGFCNNWHPWVGNVNKDSWWIECTFPSVVKDNSTCLSTLISESSLSRPVDRSCGVAIWWERRHWCFVHGDIEPQGQWHTFIITVVRGENSVNTECSHHVGFNSSFFELLESKMPMFGSTSGGKAGMSGASDQAGEGALKGARTKDGTDQGAVSSDPQNDAMSRESSPPSKPARSTEYQRSFCLTLWSTSDAIARQWYWVTSSTALCVERTDHYRWPESQHQWDHTSYNTKPSGVFCLPRPSIKGRRLQSRGSHRNSRTATWVIWPLDRGKDTYALHSSHPQGCSHGAESCQKIC